MKCSQGNSSTNQGGKDKPRQGQAGVVTGWGREGGPQGLPGLYYQAPEGPVHAPRLPSLGREGSWEGLGPNKALDTGGCLAYLLDTVSTPWQKPNFDEEISR